MKSISVNCRILACLLLLCVAPWGAAKTVRLITIGPGDAFWSAFGHTAIAIDEDVYGFGYFSFDLDTVKSFVSNQMMYELGISEINYEVLLAEQQNRTFSVIELNLDAAQTQQLEDFLAWHYLPENQTYQYDYFLNNCSTKIRDLLDMAWPEYVRANSQQVLDDSYYDHTFPTKHQGLMNLGLAMGYGWPAYQQRSQWELMAFPVFLEQHFDQMKSLSNSSRQVYYETEPSGTMEYVWKTHWALAIYVLLWTLILLPQRRTKSTKTWFVWHALIGIILLSGWLFTPHTVMSWNFNLLLFNPLGLLIFGIAWGRHVMLASWLLWAGICVYLQAWYLLPLLLPGMLAWRQWPRPKEPHTEV